MINQIPENQADFTRFCKVHGEKPSSNTEKNKYNGSIKFFSDISRGIRMRDFNKFVRGGKAKRQCIPCATSNQLLHYLDINLQDIKTESVILHVGINDVLQNSTETNINSFSNNVQEMAERCHSSNVNNVFIFGLVYAERFNVKTIENIHDKMVGLFFNFNL